MLSWLLIMASAYYTTVGGVPYTPPRSDFVKIVEVVQKTDSVLYQASLYQDSTVMYTKVWRNEAEVFADTLHDTDVQTFLRLQKSLDSTSGRIRVQWTAFREEDGKEKSKVFMKDLKSVSWLMPSKSRIKRSKTVRIIPTHRMDNDFYPVVLELQEWLRSKWR